MRVITIATRKGGTGKTATAHAVGAGFALRGYKTLFIDLDSQCNLSFDLGANIADITSYDVLMRTATARQAIQHTPGGDIIPADARLGNADSRITTADGALRLRDALVPLHQDYDVVVIDTPANLGILTRNALTASTELIIPAQAESHSLQGIALMNNLVQEIRGKYNPELRISGVLLTRYSGRTILARDMRENIAQVTEGLGIRLFDTPIRECIAVAEAQAMQRDVYTYAPRSNATADYNALMRALTEER